jgi:predicted DNA-binding transcriptional regulator AlpA
MIDRQQIAAMLGVSVDVLRRRVEPSAGFPKPALRLSQKTVRWDLVEVNKWIQRQKSAKA